MKTRMEFIEMLEDKGCPQCDSVDTYETVVSVNDIDDLDACLCDKCGHVELKFELTPPIVVCNDLNKELK